MARLESLAKGVLALALAGTIVRVSGFLYRVPLTRLIGAEGIGIFQLAMPAYGAALALVTGGIPLAVSKLVAEYAARGRLHVAEQVLRLGVMIVTVTGLIGAVVLALAAGRIAAALGNPQAVWSLLALAPAVPLFAIEICYRGYFHGRQSMTPSAVALITEQACRIAGTLAAAYALYPLGLEYAAAGAALGTDLGALGSVTYLIWKHRQLRVRARPPFDPGERWHTLAGRMALLAWPLTLGAIVIPLLSLVDVALIQRGLQRAGHSAAEATALYGHYAGMAMTLVTMPSVIIAAVCSALVPSVAAAWAAKDTAAVRERTVLAIRVTALLCIPAATGLLVVAEPICAAVFGEPLAAEPLRWAAWAALLYPLHWVLGSSLQGLGQTALPMRNVTIGVLVKLGLDAALAPLPGVGVAGVALATTTSYLVVCWLNVVALERIFGAPLPWLQLCGGPLLAAAGMGLSIWVLLQTGLAPAGAWATVLLALVLAPPVYAVLLLVSGAVDRAEWQRLAGPVWLRLERYLQPWH